MINLIEAIDTNHPLVFAISAGATACAASITYANLRRTRRQEMAGALTKFIEDPSNKDLFENADKVVHADAWNVVDQIEIRDLAGRTLSAFCKMARTATAYPAWHAVLDGSQMHTLTSFLTQVGPLVILIRHTPLTLCGKARFYNGNKAKAAAELYKALKVRDPDNVIWFRQ